MNRRFWTDAEIAQVVRWYPCMSTPLMACLLQRSERAIYSRAALLGLKKTAVYIAIELGRQKKRLRDSGASSRFRKGEAPWNAGKHYQPGGRCAQTQFPKGSLPHNTLPVGSYRITKDGTLQRKIGNAKGNNSKRWRGVHELAWIAANGPVPSGHITVFKPGMRTAELEQITAEKVECISFAENMRRNTYHRYPQPIPQLIQLRGALNRQINKRTA